MRKTRKRFMTLIEIIIVMFLITLIAGAIAYKVKDAMDYGKAFKTHQGIQQIHEILHLATAKNPNSINKINREWDSYVARSPLVNNAKTLIVDGWGVKYEVEVRKDHQGKITVSVISQAYEEYKREHDTLFDEDDDEDF